MSKVSESEWGLQIYRVGRGLLACHNYIKVFVNLVEQQFLQIYYVIPIQIIDTISDQWQINNILKSLQRFIYFHLR